MTRLAHIYRQLERGGEAYLPTEETCGMVQRLFPQCKDDVMPILFEMKKYASELVRPLFRSCLQYNGAEELDYLTCAEIDDSDVPFGVDDSEALGF